MKKTACPKVDTPEWKALVREVGEDQAYKLFFINNEIPPVKSAKIMMKLQDWSRMMSPIFVRNKNGRVEEYLMIGEKINGEYNVSIEKAPHTIDSIRGILDPDEYDNKAMKLLAESWDSMSSKGRIPIIDAKYINGIKNKVKENYAKLSYLYPKTGTLKEVIGSVLSKFSNESINSQSSALLLKVLYDNNLIDPKTRFETMNIAGLGAFQNFHNKVFLNTQVMAGYLDVEDAVALSSAVLAHETTHSILTPKIFLYQKNSNWEYLQNYMSKQEYESLKSLSDLYGRVKDKAKDNTFSDALENLDEFVASVIGNNSFRDYLDSISSEVVTDEDRSLLQKLMDLIANIITGAKKLLGIEHSDLVRLLDANVLAIASVNDPNKLALARKIMNDSEVGVDMQMIFEKTSDIDKAITKVGSHYRYSETDLINRFYNQVKDSQNKDMSITMFGGEKIEFKGLTDKQIRDKVKTDIVDRIKEFEQKVIPNLVSWINTGGNPNDFGKIFGTEYRDQRNPDINRQIASSLVVTHLELEEGETATRLDSDEIKALGINIPAFLGNNPMVLIHNETENGKPVISLFDVTNVPLGDHTNKNIFDTFEEKLGIDLKNKFKANELGIRKFMLTLTAMAIKSANPNVVIRKSGIVQMAGKANKMNSYYINLQDAVIDVRDLLNNPQIKAKFSPEMLSVLQKPEVLDPNNYEFSYLWWLMHWAKGRAQQLSPGNQYLINEDNYLTEDQLLAKRAVYDKMATTISSMITDKTNSRDVKDFLIQRQRYLENIRYADRTRNNAVEEEMQKDPEYVLINQAISQLDARSKRGLLKVNDLHQFDNNLTSQQNVANPIAQYGLIALQEGLMMARKSFIDWNNNMKQNWKDIQENYNTLHPADRYIKESLVDLSSAHFERIFKYEQYRDSKGKWHKVKTDRIHWDINDPETKQAIQEGTLLKTDVEFGRKIVESYEQTLIKFVAHKEMMEYEGLKVMTPAEKEEFKKQAYEAAKEKVKNGYEKGRVLVFGKRAKELFFSGDLKKGTNVAMDEMMNPEKYYSQTVDSDGKALSSSSAANFYVNTLLNNDKYSRERLAKFGLEVVGDEDKQEIQYSNEDANNMNSRDMEFSTKLFIMSVEKTIQAEDYILPRLNSAISNLYAYEHSSGTLMKNSRDYLIRRFKMLIDGDTELDDVKQMYVNVPLLDRNVSPAQLVMLGNHFNIFGSLALNVGTGVTAAMVNAMALLNNAIANSGTNQAGLVDIAKGMWEMAHNHRKAINVLSKLQLVDMDTDSLVSGVRKGTHTELNKDIWNSHTFQWFNWAPDFLAKAIHTIGQMIKDGTYDAYDNDGVYHESKDKRYTSDEYGTPEQRKLLREYRKKDFIEKGYMKETDKELPNAYIDREILSIRDQLSQNIVGGYMSDERTNNGYTLFGRLFDTYKVWLPNKIRSFWSSGREKQVSGNLVVKDGAVQWENEYFEGKIQSFAAAAKLLKQNYHQPLQAWAQLKTRQKQNIRRLTLDVLMATVLTLIFRGAFDDDDEKDKKGKRFITDRRVMGKFTNSSGLMRSLYYATQDLTNEWYPSSLIDLVQEPFAVIGQAKKLANLSEALITFDTDNAVNQTWKLLPFTNSISYMTEWTPAKQQKEARKIEAKKAKELQTSETEE